MTVDTTTTKSTEIKSSVLHQHGVTSLCTTCVGKNGCLTSVSVEARCIESNAAGVKSPAAAAANGCAGTAVLRKWLAGGVAPIAGEVGFACVTLLTGPCIVMLLMTLTEGNPGAVTEPSEFAVEGVAEDRETSG